MNKKIIKSLKPFVTVTWREVVIIVFGWLLSAFVTILNPKIVSELTDLGLVKRQFNIILFWTLMLLMLSFLKYGNEFLQTSIFTRVSNRFTQNMQEGIFYKIIRVPISVLQGRNQAEMLNSIYTDISKISWIMDRSSLSMFTYLFQIVGGIIGLFWLDSRMALTVLIIVLIKQIIVICMSKQKQKMATIFLETQQKFSSWFGSQIGGVTEIKLWNLYDKKKDEFKTRYSEIPQLAYQMNMWDEVEAKAGNFVALVLELIIYLGCGFLVCEGQMSIGNVFAFLTYTAYISGPLGLFTRLPYIWANIKPSAERFIELLEEPEERLILDTECHPVEDVPILKVENVSFGYNAKQRVLENVSFSIEKGEKIAIIGENGCGKTTLINLLLGLYPLEHGSIQLKGKSMKNIGLEKWRNCFALVSQKPYLFEGTIAENIDLRGDITMKRLKEITAKYGMNVVIDKFDKGFLYQINDNGTNLSGGERQKIAYLRSLIKGAEILILDEATSNCDEESRKAFRQQVFGQFFDKTIILISHYKEEIAQADHIYEIRNRTLFGVIGHQKNMEDKSSL